jgi:L-fuconolactonase
MTPERIDSHQHFWRYAPTEFAWIDEPMAAIRRDFLPGDLEPELRAAGVDGCIAVQAAQTLAESRFLLGLAEAHPFVRGVVGWVDLQSKDVIAQLREVTRYPKFVGVRHVVQAEPDPAFLLRADFQRGIGALAPYDLAYDLLVHPQQLRAASELAGRFPGQRFVLDHLGKPRIAAGQREPWAADLRALARHPNVACKLSGMVTEADWATWTADGLRPWVATALEAFGPQRLLFGSDWPVCLVASSYARWLAAVEDLQALLSPSEQAAVLGGNAARWYHLPKPKRRVHGPTGRA